MYKINWLDSIVKRLRDYSKGEIWTDCDSENFCETEIVENII